MKHQHFDLMAYINRLVYQVFCLQQSWRLIFPTNFRRQTNKTFQLRAQNSRDCPENSPIGTMSSILFPMSTLGMFSAINRCLKVFLPVHACDVLSDGPLPYQKRICVRDVWREFCSGFPHIHAS